jgi:adenylate cyclase
VTKRGDLEVGSEAWWRLVLTDPKAHFEPLRKYFLRIPSAPHCKVCGAPFKGIGGMVLGPMGFRPWAKNPSICRACIIDMNRQPPGGAEIDCTLLFADVRRSTGLAERSSATDFAELLRRFYAVGSQAVIDENGIVDKFVGDEVVALFIPVYAGPHHARRAIRCAERLLRETGHGHRGHPWLDIGIGIHTGIAFVGTVAVGGEVVDFTALGDTVNAAARVASAAGPGEVLISDAAIANAGGRGSVALEHRDLELRGREASLGVRVARLDSLGSLAPDRASEGMGRS